MLSTILRKFFDSRRTVEYIAGELAEKFLRKKNIRLYKEQITVNHTGDSYVEIIDNLREYKQNVYIK